MLCLICSDTASGEQAAGACSNGANQDGSEEQLDKTLEGLDKCVGSIIEALPVNGLLVVFTCQGDTAEYRRMQVRLPQIFCMLTCVVGPGPFDTPSCLFVLR